MNDIIFFKKKEDKPMLNIFDVAKYFLSLGKMNNKKLQKLCFYAQAWYFALYNQKLIDTTFEAWIHGPVSPELYTRYKDWGGLNIILSEEDIHNVNISEEQKQFLKTIFLAYEQYSGDDLEKLTHKEEPWKDARKNFKPDQICRVQISDDSIKTFYQKHFAMK